MWMNVKRTIHVIKKLKFVKIQMDPTNVNVRKAGCGRRKVTASKRRRKRRKKKVILKDILKMIS